MRLIRFFLIVSLLASCSAPKDIVYFQDAKNLDVTTLRNDAPIVFKEGDIISIFVSAVDMETTIPFNSSQSSANAQNGEVSAPKYVIGIDGTIDFPVLGELEIIDLSRSETIELIKQKLSEYINKPTVAVKLENFKITVLGEVNTPGEYQIENQKVNVIQALGMAGDLTIKGKRENITVIRMKNNQKIYYKLNLTSKEMFKSPAFNLNQNDIVYVEPNKSRIRESVTNNNTLAVVLGVLGVLFSFLNFAL